MWSGWDFRQITYTFVRQSFTVIFVRREAEMKILEHGILLDIHGVFVLC